MAPGKEPGKEFEKEAYGEDIDWMNFGEDFKKKLIENDKEDAEKISKAKGE